MTVPQDTYSARIAPTDRLTTDLTISESLRGKVVLGVRAGGGARRRGCGAHGEAQRMKLATTAAILALAILPTTATATTTLIDASGAPHGVAFTRYLTTAQVPTPDLTVTLIEEPCPYYPDNRLRACYAHEPNAIHVSGELPGAFHHHDVMHELAHAYDVQAMSATDRAWFARQSSAIVSPVPVDPMERFADVYATCARYGISGPRPARGLTPIRYGYRGAYRTPIYRRMCRFIRYYMDGVSWQNGGTRPPRIALPVR